MSKGKKGERVPKFASDPLILAPGSPGCTAQLRGAGPLFRLLVGQKHDTGVIAWHFNNVVAHGHPVSYLSIDIRALSCRVETFEQ